MFKKFKNFLDPKNFWHSYSLIFFLISTPKCIELNSEFVRPKKTWVLGLGLGPDPKPTETQAKMSGRDVQLLLWNQFTIEIKTKKQPRLP